MYAVEKMLSLSHEQFCSECVTLSAFAGFVSKQWMTFGRCRLRCWRNISKNILMRVTSGAWSTCPCAGTRLFMVMLQALTGNSSRAVVLSGLY